MASTARAAEACGRELPKRQLNCRSAARLLERVAEDGRGRQGISASDFHQTPWGSSSLSAAFHFNALAQSGARLTGAEITQLINGKQAIFRGSKLSIRGTKEDPEYFIRSDGVVTDNVLVFRDDRTYRRLCTYRARDGSTGPCGGTYQGVGTGIWRVSGNTLCLGEIIVPGRETCYEVDRAGPKYRARYVSGGLTKGTIRGVYDGMEFELAQ